MTIGVAGCGRMGAPMLHALLRAGFDARGFDLRHDLGQAITTDRDTFAAGLTTLITVVRDADETDALLFDDQGFAGLPDLQTIIISSTLSPRYVTDLRARVPAHITLIDAPMSGAQVAAEAAQLTFMIGGECSAQMPLFQAMGDTFHHMGAYGAGMSAKVLNNLLAASSTAMTRLVLDWADAADIDEDQLLALINSASGQNWLASGFNDIEFARDGYSTDNSIGILAKDVTAALDMAPKGADLTLPQSVCDAIRALTPRKGRHLGS